MINSNINEILCGYAISEHKDTGILIAEKQIFLPEKEILMMVVEKSIRDSVLNAIYKQMGMAKKAKGIAFSLPVSDVAGLAVAEPQAEETEV